MNRRVSIMKYHVLTGVSLEVNKRFPLTAGHSAFIFSQALITDKGDSRFWPAKASSLKQIETHACCTRWERVDSSFPYDYIQAEFQSISNGSSPSSPIYFPRKNNNDNNTKFLPKSSENNREKNKQSGRLQDFSNNGKKKKNKHFDPSESNYLHNKRGQKRRLKLYEFERKKHDTTYLNCWD